MEGKEFSSERARESKTSAASRSDGDHGEGCAASWTMRKRKCVAEEKTSEGREVPAKKRVRSESGGADGIGNESSSHLEDLVLDDFENDPFLSPKKKGSPCKSVLGENFESNESRFDESGEVNFESTVRCTVVETKFRSGKWFEQVLVLRDCESKRKGVCKLREAWTSLSLSVGEVVSVQATSCEGSWVVNNKGGFLVVEPDLLVSSTGLVNSMFCLRRGVLGNFFKEFGVEESGNMVVGRVVHEVFQECLRTGVSSEEEVGKIIDKCLGSRDILHEIFLTNRNIAEVDSETKKFIPSLKSFMDTYVYKRAEPRGKNFDGTIESIVDIEEVVKAPALGLQGRADVTVKVRSKKREKISPLELKTGRASFSSEHRSQLTLYVLVMKELGRKVDSGLLLYLRENVMEEVVPSRDEIRNLLLLRNHFVGYCKGVGRCHLPEPVRNVKYCSNCSYLRVCTAFVRGGEGDKIAESHPLRSMEVADVKPEHVEYFMKWTEMLWMELEEGEERMESDEVVGLSLEPGGKEEKSRKEFRHEFVRGSGDSERIGLRSGTFVQVMDGQNKRICRGQVVETREGRISVLTDKRLTDFSDGYKLVAFKSKFLSVCLSNLGWFLREEFQALRELIIDKRMPRFDKNLDKADFREKCLKNLLKLNKEQREAVLKSLLCQDYLLIKGPPGTGKTQTIVALIKILLALNKNVLVSSHTNSAVDNILLKLDGVEYLRLGSLGSIHEDVRRNSYSRLKETCSSVEDVRNLFERKVKASTCMGIDANLVGRLKVEYCVLDESSQILQAEALRPLLCCRKFILVGDEDQLPPVVRNPKAKALGMCESMFDRLANDQATVRLKLQYRMNSVINSLANAITYGGLIECANEEVGKATMKVRDAEEYRRSEEWVAEVLSNELEKSVVFVDTSEYFRVRKAEYETERRRSLLEANIVARLGRSLMRLGVKEESVGVISPFWDQILALKSKLGEEGLDKIEVSTVDQYQGRDKEVILLSCAKENESERRTSGQELLSDERRLTVAVTRAKHKLIILGDKESLVKYEPLRKLVRNLKESQFVRLSDGRKGFFWDKFIK